MFLVVLGFGVFYRFLGSTGCRGMQFRIQGYGGLGFVFFFLMVHGLEV